MRFRPHDISLSLQSLPQIDVYARVAWLEKQCLLITFDGLLAPAGGGQQVGKVVMDDSLVRLQSKRLSIVQFGLFEIVPIIEKQSKIVASHPAPWGFDERVT